MTWVIVIGIAPDCRVGWARKRLHQFTEQDRQEIEAAKLDPAAARRFIFADDSDWSRGTDRRFIGDDDYGKIYVVRCI